MTDEFEARAVMDARGFVLLGDYVPGIVQEIRYYTTFNFVGDRINGYEEPCAITTIELFRLLVNIFNLSFILNAPLLKFVLGLT